MLETAFSERGPRLFTRGLGAAFTLGGTWFSVEVARQLYSQGVAAVMMGVAVPVQILAVGLVALFLPDMVRWYASRQARMLRETLCRTSSFACPLAILAPLAILWNGWMAFLAWAIPLADLLSDAPLGVSILFRFVFPAAGIPLLIWLAYELVQRYHFRGWRLRLGRAEVRADEWVSFELIRPPRVAAAGGRRTTLLLVSRKEAWGGGWGSYWRVYGMPLPFPGQVEFLSEPGATANQGRFRAPADVLGPSGSLPRTRLWLFLSVRQGRWLRCLFEIPLSGKGGQAPS